jgi:hypothetical protein
MSIEIISHREPRDIAEFQLFFSTGPGAGFGFPCDRDGLVDAAALPEAASANYRRAQDGEFGAGELQDLSRTIMDPARGRCDCGRTLTLWGDQACDCGRLYNSAGQELRTLSFQDTPGEDY